jgi:hypothetical protein
MTLTNVRFNVGRIDKNKSLTSWHTSRETVKQHRDPFLTLPSSEVVFVKDEQG